MPPAIAAWNAASERPATQRGAESWTPILNSATASIQTAPATTSAAAVKTGSRGPALADLGDVERADHRTHAEGPEHDAVGLRPAMQQVARHQRHQGRYRTAVNA